MRSFAALLLLLVSSASGAQTPVGRCFAACERHVSDPRLRASACGACLTQPDHANGWLARLPAPPPGLLADDDWQVRWAGLLLEARAQKTTAPRRLGAWLGRAKGADLQRACLTAVHAAGALKEPLTALLADERSGLEACTARQQALREALWVELYSENAPTRLEALRHLAQAWNVSPARALLDALPSHPAAFDELQLETLASWAVEADVAPGASLLAAATPADVEAMNRLLAVFSRRRDEARPRLASPEDTVRREALTTLAEAAPWSEPELLIGLSDLRPALRLKAARALARGEGRTLCAMVAARLSGEKPATEDQQLALLTLAADVHERDCAERTLETWRDVKRPPALRRRALAVAASCQWDVARQDVETALGGERELERSAAVGALGFGPRGEQAQEQLARATSSEHATVRAAACQSIAQHRWRAGLGRVTPLAADAEPAVRSEALRALAALDAPGLEARLTGALESDRAPSVRGVAAELLAAFTGPRASSALERAARNDPDPGVKLVAAQSLRKLRPGSPAP